MIAKIYHLTLATRHGPATFLLSIDGGATVQVKGLPFAGLPESVPRLTYGKHWEAALDYFRRLAVTLPYRVGEGLRMAAAPEGLEDLVKEVTKDFPELNGAPAPFWSTHGEYAAAYAFDESTMNAALFRLARPGVFEDSKSLAVRILPYLLSLLPVASHASTRLIYSVMGAMKTDSARNALLDGLELEGRHPYTTELLGNLAYYLSNDTRQRLEGVYRAGRIADDDLEHYLHLLSLFQSSELAGHLTEILRDHPGEVANVVQAMRSNGLKRKPIAEIVHGVFQSVDDYYALDPLLRALNGLQISQYAIDLEAMNTRVALPTYTDLPPVNWPQQLEPGWSRLVLGTAEYRALEILGNFLDRAEPRLQRNALLQLKVLLRDSPLRKPLPRQIEDRLRNLLNSRYDKVYVEVLNVLGRRDLPLHDREAMLDAVLSVSIGSRYRFVVLTALSRIGNTPELKRRAQQYLAGEIAAAGSPARLEQIGALLPFVEKYLGNIAPLRRELSERTGDPSNQ